METAALLHDLDKALPADHELRPLGHGHAGARWLTEHGYSELAPAVANHPVTRLGDASHSTLEAFATREERIVAYADKRAAQRLGSMDKRFARWRRRHPEQGARLTLARERADRLERDVCDAAGIEPGKVSRLSWVKAAMAGKGNE